MIKSRAEKIVNLLSAFLVLLVGLYVLLFVPLNWSAPIRIIIGALLVFYFLGRLQYYRRKTRDTET